MKPYYSDDAVTIYHGDCREILPTLTMAGVVVTDPPYGTGGWRRPEAGAGSNPSASLVREDWDLGDVDWVGLVALRPILTFWPAARTRLLLEAAEAAGYPKHRAIYWHKPDPKPQVGGRTRWSIEPIWSLSPDGFLLIGETDLYQKSALRSSQPGATGHPYEKPVDVMRWVVAKTSALAMVIDPFAGSGSTLVAAKSLSRKAIGIEKDERWCESAARRCAQEVLGLSA